MSNPQVQNATITEAATIPTAHPYTFAERQHPKAHLAETKCEPQAQDATTINNNLQVAVFRAAPTSECGGASNNKPRTFLSLLKSYQMNPFITITYLNDSGRQHLTKDITEDQRQQIISIIKQQPDSHPLKFRYEELNTYDGHKAIFAIETTSSNQDPNYTNSRKLFHTYNEAYKEYTEANAEVGTTRNLSVLFPSPFQSNPPLTLNQWNEQSPTAKTLYTETNRGKKIMPDHTVFVFDMDNQIIDIRPPFISEQYQDDLIDWTDCFERHLITEPMNNADRIRYALEKCSIQPDTPEYERSKNIIYHQILLRNFSK